MAVATDQELQLRPDANPRAASESAPQPEPAGVLWNWLAVLVFLAALLRAIALNQQLWYDEITTLVDSVRQPLEVIVSTYQSQNQHTLYSVLARMSIVLFGEHPWTLRLPAVVFGVAAVPALYFCAREVARPGGRRESLLAATLLAVSYHHVWFSQNARGYTALAFWTLVATYLFLRGLKERRAHVWISYGAVLALGMYTHLTMAFVAAGHGLVYLWWLAARRGQPRETSDGEWVPLGGFLAGGAFTLILYGPVLGEIFGRTVGQAGASSVTSDWTNPIWLLAETLRGLAAGLGGSWAGVAVVVAGGIALAGLWSFWRQNRFLVGLVFLPMGITAAVMLALAHNLWPRFFFFAIGFAFLLLVRGMFVTAEWAGRRAGREAAARRWATAVVLVIAAASAWTVRSAWIYPKQDFVGAMEFVDAERQPGDVVFTVGMTSLPYHRYFGRNWLWVDTAEELERLRAGHQRAWLLYTLPTYLQSRHPDLWDTIGSDFETVRVFRGTLGDGEIYVCRTKTR